jgi:pilus assembly protein FimV
MKRAVRRALLLSALAAPSALYALGLGEIRLNSALNQPFDAEIELVSATSEDLGALRAALASGDTFERYGLDKPAFLSDFTFRVVRSGDRDVLRVTSPRPVTEPFVTLLVEASWPRGRLLREYTVLLDPPVFASAPVAAAPVAAPRATSAPSAAAPGAEPRPEPRPAPVAAPAAEESVARTTIAPGSTYRVRPNDTLWRIASAANPGPRSEVNRMMVAIFEANPGAFAGNINVLRADAELRIPASSDVAAISAAAAADEVARQYRQWSEGGSAAAATSDAGGRLRLVTPDQAGAATSPATAVPAVSPATDTELQDRLQRLEAELADTRRLLEVRNAELATLQGAAPAAEPGEVAEPEVPVSPVPDAMPAAAAAEAEAKAEAAPVAEPEPAPKPERKAPPAAVDEPSIFERLQEYWWILLGLLAAALGIGVWLRRRRQSEPLEDSLAEALGRRPGDDLRARAPVAARSAESDILVEERQPAEPAIASVATAATAAVQPAGRTVTVADTLSGDGAVSIEAGDPLAEADFHMAYGLYDQAAELVQVASRREPQRRDLKLKLIEIFFVWGNRERFLEVARDMHATRAQAGPGEWDKILIMGRQLAPEEPLFAGAGAPMSSDLDLELFSGAAATDFELPGGEGPAPDLDLTVLSPEVRGDDSVDFLLDEPDRGGAGGDSEFAPTVKTLGVRDDSSLAPTIEAPRLERGPALEPTVETARFTGNADEPTAEVAIEDLGLDASALQDLEDITQLEATLVDTGAGVEDTVQEPALERGSDPSEAQEPDLLSATSMLKVDLEALAEQVANEDRTLIEERSAIVDLSDATGEAPAIDLDDLDATGELERIDSKVAGDITMSEVGTKLDLARAYVDMGDPEGARSILEEVLKEGSAAHKQEASRLMSVLP